MKKDVTLQDLINADQNEEEEDEEDDCNVHESEDGQSSPEKQVDLDQSYVWLQSQLLHTQSLSSTLKHTLDIKEERYLLET